MENWSRESEKIMIESFGRDTLLALATTENGVPSVRNVNAYYEDGAFYIITYALSNKMRQIESNPTVAITGEWFTAHGKGVNLGYFGKEENRVIAEKLRHVFAAWIDNGHNNFEDQNTILLRVDLTDGVLFSHGTRYEFGGPGGAVSRIWKGSLIAAFRALPIPELEELKELHELKGSFINLEYPLPGGQRVRLWDDNQIYLGNQLHKKGCDRCYGIAADDKYLMVSEYGENGSDAELVLFQRWASRYRIKGLGKNEVAEVFALCAQNTTFYQYHPPFVTEESILEDMQALPPGKEPSDKAYVGFYEESRLVAVLDLIFDYPQKDTAYIGFFMMDMGYQGRGIGTAIISECAAALAGAGMKKLRLAIDKGNPQSEAFWSKNGFVKTGEEIPNDHSAYVPMERELFE